MKAWRNESARTTNEYRKFIKELNETLPRDKRLTVPLLARDAMRVELRNGKHMASSMVKSTWLLSGLMVRAGLQPAP